MYQQKSNTDDKEGLVKELKKALQSGKPIDQVGYVKSLRKELAETINNLREIKDSKGGRERALAITKLQEARMWLGMVLQEAGEPYPYPNGDNVNSPYVDAPADI